MHEQGSSFKRKGEITVHINDAIQAMQVALINEQWEEAEARLNQIRSYVRNGGEMEPHHYDAMRDGHTLIMKALVDRTPELQTPQV